MQRPVIAILDIGKTNKKLFLMDEQYHIVLEKSTEFEEIQDDDGDLCEDIDTLTHWVVSSLKTVIQHPDFEVKAINFSTYGASFVLLKTKPIGSSGRVEGEVVAPLYNYLKPFPADLKNTFYDNYGGEVAVSSQTASPILGNLNSGMQLYSLKKKKPTVFAKINAALHLPQYASYLVTKRVFSDITSIGCHTSLWDFEHNDYHQWVKNENIDKILPPIFPSDAAIPALFENKELIVGVGLHDSSAALIPYLACFNEPFILISTGTWCISLNPFNNNPLAPDELAQDCLCYMTYQGKPVKASRLFAGNEHQIQAKRIADYFGCAPDFYKTIPYNPDIIANLSSKTSLKSSYTEGGSIKHKKQANIIVSDFEKRDMATFENETEAYHQLMLDLMVIQTHSTQLIIQNTPVKHLFVDGGFSKNSLYMTLLAKAFPALSVFAASVAQATALGAALAIHRFWNRKPLRNDLIELKSY
jgi:sugar (pentulose or hexulose) kinase